MKNSLVLVFALLLVILSSGCKHATEPVVQSVPHNKILFDSQRNGSIQLFMMNPDGSGIEQLTHEPGTHMDGCWSRDASMLACEFGEGGADGGGEPIALRTTDGHERLLNTRGEWPRLSTNNRYMAVSTYYNISSIYDMQKDSTVLTLFWTYVADWSIDGSKLLLMRISSKESGYIHYLALAGFPDTGIVQMIGPPGARYGAWNPQGNLIAFSKDPDSAHNGEICTMDNKGDNVYLVTHHTTSDYYQFPRWSPDGKEILFISGGSLMIVSKEGGTPRVILKDSTIINCDWSW